MQCCVHLILSALGILTLLQTVFTRAQSQITLKCAIDTDIHDKAKKTVLAMPMPLSPLGNRYCHDEGTVKVHESKNKFRDIF